MHAHSLLAFMFEKNSVGISLNSKLVSNKCIDHKRKTPTYETFFAKFFHTSAFEGLSI